MSSKEVKYFLSHQIGGRVGQRPSLLKKLKNIIITMEATHDTNIIFSKRRIRDILFRLPVVC